jgi:hypothetical protein
MQNRRFLPALILFLLLIPLGCNLPAPFFPPTPTATLPASGSLLFEDDFSNRSTGWDTQSASQGVMDYHAGGYRMFVNELEANFWSTPHKDLADVRIEVDEGKLAGPDENRAGLICRYSGEQFYFFIISHDGFYGIGHFQSSNQTSAGQMDLIGQSEMEYSPVINRGTNINHLRADCAGDTLTFYVNGEQIAQVQDPRLKHGDVGLLAGSFSEPGVDVIFDNFVAVQP